MPNQQLWKEQPVASVVFVLGIRFSCYRLVISVRSRIEEKKSGVHARCGLITLVAI